TPALCWRVSDSVMIVRSSDGRRQFRQLPAMNLGPNAGPAQQARQAAADPYNNDLYSTEISLGPAARAAAVKPFAPGNDHPGADAQEAAAGKRIRDYRGGAYRLVRGEFHRHSEVSMDGGNDGSLLDQWRYALDAAALDWIGCCDHDNGNGREYTWWITQKLTDLFPPPGAFPPMSSYEPSAPSPEGPRNVISPQRAIRPLPRLPITSADAPGNAPDTQMLYAYLKRFDGIVASHTSAT